LKSFEDHALRGNEFAVEGMQSDIQGMAIAVEHTAAALGATETQLLEKYKQLWQKQDVLALLKRGDVSPLARQSRLAEDWPSLKAKINALRTEPGGEIAADLVMAHRIRGGVHAFLPEDDHFELEALFTGLIRAALLTFIGTASGAEGKTKVGSRSSFCRQPSNGTGGFVTHISVDISRTRPQLRSFHFIQHGDRLAHEAALLGTSDNG
jgi:hypothetical protein